MRLGPEPTKPTSWTIVEPNVRGSGKSKPPTSAMAVENAAEEFGGASSEADGSAPRVNPDPSQGRNHPVDLQGRWPHRAREKRGLRNSGVVHSAAKALSAPPLTYFLRRDDSDYVVFLLCQPEDPQTFCERFGGERLATPATALPLRENQVDRSMERGRNCRGGHQAAD
jgi:hypothetical protein